MKPASPWLVCYDIAEPRRLARVGRAAREFGVPLQYSVLWARLDGIGLGAAMGAIATRIDPRRDVTRTVSPGETLSALRTMAVLSPFQQTA